MLPQKTFLEQSCRLYESDFDVTGNVKPRRIMEFMQDVATSHADILGIGWDSMNANGLFWVLSKVKIAFKKPLTRSVREFKLYTWPVASKHLYAERRFKAVNGQGETLFCASTLWMIVERDSRRIVSRETLAKYYDFDFDSAECDCDNSFDRIRRDETYVLAYVSKIRRTDLDVNKHVNNTRYVDYALDVLSETDNIAELEIVYHRELTLNDEARVYARRDGDVLRVVGERNNEACFTVKLTLR